MKALRDTNIVLDVLLDRNSHLFESAEVFRLVEQGRVESFFMYDYAHHA